MRLLQVLYVLRTYVYLDCIIISFQKHQHLLVHCSAVNTELINFALSADTDAPSRSRHGNKNIQRHHSEMGQSHSRHHHHRRDHHHHHHLSGLRATTSSRAKRVTLRRFYIRDIVRKGKVGIYHVSAEGDIADLGTNKPQQALPPIPHRADRKFQALTQHHRGERDAQPTKRR